MANTTLKLSQSIRAVPARRSSPGGELCVRFEAQRPADFSPIALESFGDEQRRTLGLLQSHPGKWLRPATDAGLLACLVLSLEGFAEAVEDENGMRFRYSHSVQLLV